MLTRRRFPTVRWGILFGLLIVMLVATSALAAGTFTDDDGNTHEANIEAIAAEGITKGCNPPVNDLYCPKDPVTRGQMAAFLRRAFNLPAAVEDHFADDDGTTFEGDINALAEAGITKGCNPPANDRYCPQDSVTRGQMAAFLRRAFDYPSVNTDFFIDDDSSIFEGDINAIAGQGVTKGCNPPANDLYCPKDLVLRDQMASFLARALDLTPIDPESIAVWSCGIPVDSDFLDCNGEVNSDLEGPENWRCFKESIFIDCEGRVATASETLEEVDEWSCEPVLGLWACQGDIDPGGSKEFWECSQVFSHSVSFECNDADLEDGTDFAAWLACEKSADTWHCFGETWSQGPADDFTCTVGFECKGRANYRAAILVTTIAVAGIQ